MMVISFLLFCCLGIATPFRINCKTPLTKPSALDLKSSLTKLRRCERISVYHHPDGVENTDPVPVEDGNTLKTQKLTAVNQKTVLSVVAVIVASAAIFGAWNLDVSSLLEKFLLKIGSLGSLGYLYFSMIYVIAEVMCIPALPLAASSGYLFGLIPGFLTVLVSATLAACVSFVIGRTLLRGWAQKIANGNDKWRAIDSAIGREGFKVILLLRITPLFPFSIVNYLYGLTSVNFWSYLTATLLGFTPGTLAIVYAGTAGKAILSKGLGDYPWYCYLAAGGLALLLGKAVTKFATDAMKSIETEGAAASASATAIASPRQPMDEAISSQ